MRDQIRFSFDRCFAKLYFTFTSNLIYPGTNNFSTKGHKREKKNINRMNTKKVQMLKKLPWRNEKVERQIKSNFWKEGDKPDDEIKYRKGRKFEKND